MLGRRDRKPARRNSDDEKMTAGEVGKMLGFPERYVVDTLYKKGILLGHCVGKHDTELRFYRGHVEVLQRAMELHGRYWEVEA